MEATNTFPTVAALVIFVLVVAAVVALVLVRVEVPLWRTSKRCHVSYAWAPVVGALLMLACQCQTPLNLLQGIKGDANLQPWAIVVLFMALAYIAATLDLTGVFAWLALQITHWSKGNGRSLFVLYFCLSTIMTAVTSNDVTILCLTPIIMYMSASANVAATPFLVAQYATANIGGMLFFVSNPTNIIVANAFQLSFIDYTRWMALPTVAATLACLALLLVVYHRHIPARLELPNVPPAAMLTDRLGAVLGSVNLLVCLALLSAAPALGWAMWLITVVCAALAALYSFAAYVVRPRLSVRLRRRGTGWLPDVSVELAKLDDTAFELADSVERQHNSAEANFMDYEATKDCSSSVPGCAAGAAAPDLAASASSSARPHHDSCVLAAPAASAETAEAEAARQLLAKLQPKKPGFLDAIVGLPWDIVPFVLGMFAMVQGLGTTGWIDKLAVFLGNGAEHGLAMALFVMGSVSVLLANVMNNQPMTILLTRVCLNPLFTAAVGSARNVQASLFAVVVGSNVGGNYTLIGALAGIMWVNILAKRGYHVGYMQFAKLIMPAGMLCTAVSLVVLGAEFLFMS